MRSFKKQGKHYSLTCTEDKTGFRLNGQYRRKVGNYS